MGKQKMRHGGTSFRVLTLGAGFSGVSMLFRPLTTRMIIPLTGFYTYRGMTATVTASAAI